MHRMAARLLAVAALTLTLAACENAQDVADGVNQVAEGVNTAQECASVVGGLADINFDPSQADPAAVRQRVEEMEQSIQNLESADVQSAAEGLAGHLRTFADAVEQADPAEARQAVDNAANSLQQVAQACGVPVEDLNVEITVN